jgi:hypothetical protein
VAPVTPVGDEVLKTSMAHSGPPKNTAATPRTTQRIRRCTR